MRAAFEDPEDIQAIAFLMAALWVTVELSFEGGGGRIEEQSEQRQLTENTKMIRRWSRL